MENPILGFISLLVASIIIYVMASGSSDLSKTEKLVCAGWVVILIFMSSKLI